MEIKLAVHSINAKLSALLMETFHTARNGKDKTKTESLNALAATGLI